MQELKLCSKCAELGHKQQDCIKTEEVNKEFYENMLKLVTAYRTLVKEQGTLQMPVYSSNALAPINKPAEPSKNAPQKTNAELKRSRTTKEPIEMITLDSDSDNEATSHNQPKNVHTEVTPSEVDNADVIPNGEQIDGFSIFSHWYFGIIIFFS
jgi:hypothetical protein